MINIIVAFPKLENGKSIKRILVKSGFQVQALCCTGAQALLQADMLGEGIVVCAGRLQDMTYTQLREYLPPHMGLLVLAPPGLWEEGIPEHVVCLSMPLKVHELTATLEMMCKSQEKARRKQKTRPVRRSEEEQRVIQEAKELLMARNHMAEEEAHRYLQNCSMDSGTSLPEAAQMILSMMQ